MHFELGQKIIDKIRNKKKNNPIIENVPVEDSICKLKGIGCKIIGNKIVFPNDIKMNLHNSESELCAMCEIYIDKAYNMNDYKESIFIDIGMNYAITSLYYAKEENVKHIYSFEPFKTTYGRAIENIELNPAIKNKITTYNIGLGNSNKKITILYDENLAGCMSLTSNRFDPQDPTYCEIFKKENAVNEECLQKDASEALTPIINDNIGKRIILKIDTEGAEYDILESLDNSGLLKKIDIVLIEFHFKGSKELQRRLLKNGFVTREETDFIFGVKAE